MYPRFLIHSFTNGHLGCFQHLAIMKRCSASLIIREMQIKTTMRYHLIPVRMAVINKSTNKSWQRCRQKEILLYCWCECRLVQPLWKTVWRYLKKIKSGCAFRPSNPTSGNVSEGTQSTNLKEYKHPIFTAALFTITKIWKQPKLSVNRWVNKTTLGHLHNGILLSCKKKTFYPL